MATLQEQQFEIDRGIIEEVVAATPESWNAAVLTVERVERPGSDVETLAVEIRSPEGHPEVIVPPDELYELVRRLDLVIRGATGRAWRSVRYLITHDPSDDSWGANAKFEY